MNKRFAQKGGKCTGFAILNAGERVVPTARVSEEDVYKFYEAFDDEREGMRVSEILRKMRTVPMGSLFAASYEELYNPRIRTLQDKATLLTRARAAMRKPYTGVIVGFKLMKKKPKIKLTKQGVFMKTGIHDGDMHMMFLLDFWRDGSVNNRGVIIENSWGKDFGKDGLFFMKTQDFLDEIEGCISITFKP